MPTIDEMKEWVHAYKVGEDAGRLYRNQKNAANPYPAGSRHNKEWMRGFTAACEKRGAKPLLGAELAAQKR